MISDDRAVLPRFDRLPLALAACFALASTMMMTFPIIAPDVMSELGLSYAQTGVITAAYLLGYGLFQIPASFLGIRLGSERVLFGATVLMSTAAILPCFFDSLLGWVIARFVMGIGGAAVLPLSVHLLTQAMSGPRLLRGLGIYISGWGFGMTVAMLGAAPILHAFGWRPVMFSSAALGLVVIAGQHWALPARERGRDAVAAQPPSVIQFARRLGGSRALNLMSIINVAGTTTIVCVPAWLPLYLTGTFGTSAAETSASLSPIGIAGAFGAWMGGAMAIRLGWRPVVVAALLTSGIIVASIPLQSSAWFIIAAAILTSWIAMFFAAPTQSLFSFVVPADWTGLAASYYNTIGFIGAFLASLVFGFLVDWFSTFTVGWLWVASVLVVGIVAALLLPVVSRINSMPSPQ